MARNWRVREGELDLVCVHGDTVVFCEVKTRRSDRYGSPLEAVTYSKRARIRRLAAMWLAEQERHWTTVRFDVAAVERSTVTVVPDAF